MVVGREGAQRVPLSKHAGIDVPHLYHVAFDFHAAVIQRWRLKKGDEEATEVASDDGRKEGRKEGVRQREKTGEET